MKKVLSIILIASLFVAGLAPIADAAYTQAQIKQYWMNVCKTAQQDADKDTNFFLWAGAGCLLGPLGVLASYFIIPTSNAERLIGKNAAYASQYTKCYHDAVIGAQSGKAWLGCGIEAAVIAIYYIFVIVVFAKAASSVPAQ
jgi:hypothetical protein